MRRLALSLVALVCMAAALWPSSAPAQNASTGEVKAAFLFNFARFTEWPTRVFDVPGSPLVFGVMGDEQMRQSLEVLTRGKSVEGRPLKTREVRNTDDLQNIHVLYLGTSARTRGSEILRALNGAPVLTIGDSNGFCESGGMITFLVENNRVQFEIGLPAIEQAGLKLSSRVLTLARKVHGTH